MAFSDNMLIKEGLRDLQARLPPGWKVGDVSFGVIVKKGPGAGFELDAVAEIRAPDGKRGSLAIEAKPMLSPKSARDVLARMRAAGVKAPLILSRFVSVATRELLRDEGVGFIDLTGNMRVVLSEPGLFIEAVGASENPEPAERTISFAAPKAARIARALVESSDAAGVRELATSIDVDAGYVSRVYTFLDSEALIQRVGRGRLDKVDWEKLLRRWASDAPFSTRGRIASFVDPRGAAAAMERLRGSKRRYAVTGSFAAARLSPVAAPRLLTVYTDDAVALAEELKLRPADAGANVQLVTPDDEDVFIGSALKDGVRYASPVQTVLDLSTGPGRSPAEGEEIIEWMKKNERAWRG